VPTSYDEHAVCQDSGRRQREQPRGHICKQHEALQASRLESSRVDTNQEFLQGGITHAFVVEFDNEEDRKYYLEKDPAHLAFVKSIGAVVKKAQVVDFTSGVF